MCCWPSKPTVLSKLFKAVQVLLIGANLSLTHTFSSLAICSVMLWSHLNDILTFECLKGTKKFNFDQFYTLGQKSMFYPKIHFSKITIFIKFTFWNVSFSQNSQNSHFEVSVYHKIHILKSQIFTKFTFEISVFHNLTISFFDKIHITSKI